MFKKFIVIVMMFASLTACGQKSPNIYGDGRYMVEEVNSYVTKVTDLKTNKVQYRAKDGDKTQWFDNETTWEEACVTWDNASIQSWDDI